MAKEKKDRYVEIDVESLANILAEEDYKVQTKGIPDADLWEVEMVQRQGQVYVDRGVHSHWSRLFHDLKENYLQLIKSYKKK